MNTSRFLWTLFLAAAAVCIGGAQVSTSERQLAGLTLRAEIGGLKLYSPENGEEHIVTKGNAVLVSARTVDGEREEAFYEKGSLVYQRAADSNGSTIRSFKNVVRNGIVEAAYIDNDGDGRFEQYYDFAARKRFRVELIEVQSAP